MTVDAFDLIQNRATYQVALFVIGLFDGCAIKAPIQRALHDKPFAAVLVKYFLFNLVVACGMFIIINVFIFNFLEMIFTGSHEIAEVSAYIVPEGRSPTLWFIGVRICQVMEIIFEIIRIVPTYLITDALVAAVHARLLVPVTGDPTSPPPPPPHPKRQRVLWDAIDRAFDNLLLTVQRWLFTSTLLAGSLIATNFVKPTPIGWVIGVCIQAFREAYYMCSYRWPDTWSLSRQGRHCERRFGYYLGYGLPFTLLIRALPDTIEPFVTAIFYPLYAVVSLVACGPAPASATLRKLQPMLEEVIAKDEERQNKRKSEVVDGKKDVRQMIRDFYSKYAMQIRQIGRIVAMFLPVVGSVVASPPITIEESIIVAKATTKVRNDICALNLGDKEERGDESPGLPIWHLGDWVSKKCEQTVMKWAREMYNKISAKVDHSGPVVETTAPAAAPAAAPAPAPAEEQEPEQETVSQGESRNAFLDEADVEAADVAAAGNCCGFGN